MFSLVSGNAVFLELSENAPLAKSVCTSISAKASLNQTVITAQPLH
jgi:hypothetical protein